MPTSVRLDDRTEAIVRRIASRREISRSEVIREAIVAYGEAQAAPVEGSLYERMKPFIGVFHGPSDLSEDTGERFHRLLVEDQSRQRRRPARRHK